MYIGQATRRVAFVAGFMGAVLTATGAGATRDARGLVGSARGLPQYGPVVKVGDMPRVPGVFPATTAFAVADFNGDGLPDVLATQALSRSRVLYPPVVFVNNGHGGFTDQTDALFSGQPPLTISQSRVLVADFNRDSRPDVFIADFGSDLPGDTGHQDALILSAPGGKLVDATANLPQQNMYTATASVADVNGDGAPDIFVGGWLFIGGNEILLNDGSGHFTIEPHGVNDDVANFAAGCRTVSASAFADVDGNGTPDLIIGGSTYGCYPGPPAVLLNDGHGRFPEVTQQLPLPPFGFWGATDIAVGNLNGDGAPDLVLGYSKLNLPGVWFQILINNGHGHFRDETKQRLPQSDNNIDAWVWWLRLVDLNGDGHLDIATNLGISGPHFSPYFLNDGAGHFTELPDDLGFGSLETYSLVDLGGGRGLDILNGGKDASIWLARTKPQSSSRRLFVTLGPGSYFSFIDESGRRVRVVRPGFRELVVWDRSPTRAIRLRGPGVSESITTSKTIEYWEVTFKPNTRYTFWITNPAHRVSFATN